MHEAAPPFYGLVHRSIPHRSWRRQLRSAIHFVSYHLILKRRTVRVARVNGFRLTVRPTVFHPGYFVTSKFFAAFIETLDLSDKRVADIGTGSGILALAAARAGAARVTAVDINPNAALSAAENARANGLGDRVNAVCADLLSAFAPEEIFDVIISSPPSFPGKARDVADRAWYAGLGYRDIAALFAEARQRLAPGGHLYLLLSSDSDLTLLSALIAEAGFKGRVAAERFILIESFIIYALDPQ